MANLSLSLYVPSTLIHASLPFPVALFHHSHPHIWPSLLPLTQISRQSSTSSLTTISLKTRSYLLLIRSFEVMYVICEGWGSENDGGGCEWMVVSWVNEWEWSASDYEKSTSNLEGRELRTQEPSSTITQKHEGHGKGYSPWVKASDEVIRHRGQKRNKTNHNYRTELG